MVATRGMSKGVAQTDGPQVIGKGFLRFNALQLGLQWKNVSSTSTDGEGSAFVSASRKFGSLQLTGGVAYKFNGVKALPGLNAAVIYHRFDSDYGNRHYGDEWNASLGFKVKRTAILAKYANYQAKGFGVETEKFWLQLEFAY